MPLTELEKREWELKAFGCLIDDFKASLKNSIDFKLDRPAMVALSLMSDAQEEINLKLYNCASQTLNRAKWILSEYVMDQRDQGPSL